MQGEKFAIQTTITRLVHSLPSFDRKVQTSSTVGSSCPHWTHTVVFSIYSVRTGAVVHTARLMVSSSCNRKSWFIPGDKLTVLVQSDVVSKATPRALSASRPHPRSRIPVVYLQRCPAQVRRASLSHSLNTVGDFIGGKRKPLCQ